MLASSRASTEAGQRDLRVQSRQAPPRITPFSMVKHDIRNQPAYTVAEAARYLKVAPATLRSWVAGRDYPKGDGTAHSNPLIRPARNPPPTLSFWNLIESHVLRSLRNEHGVSMDALRKAIRYAQHSLKIDRLLLSQELRTDAGKLLLERYGELIELSASGQMAMRRTFNDHLARVEWDQWKFPVRLFPFTTSGGSATERPISIDAHVAFGRPILAQRGITTGTIAARIDAGESISDLADDYDLSANQIEEAVLYERAA
jgi:uncharacterized protein (DUF433 family)